MSLRWGIEEGPPLEHVTARKLRRTSARPAEWVGTDTNGNRIYIVANGTHLMFGVGEYNDVLASIKNKSASKIKHNALTSDVSTAKMIEITGLKFADGVTVNDVPIGELV